MVRTFGLTHIGLAVRDVERSVQFYGTLLGARVTYRDANSVQVETPGGHDVIVFEQDSTKAGRAGGVSHFGFRLRRPKDIEAALRDAKAAGGRILRKGEFVAGEPYLFVADPDGYEVELWYEHVASERKRRKSRGQAKARDA